MLDVQDVLVREASASPPALQRRLYRPGLKLHASRRRLRGRNSKDDQRSVGVVGIMRFDPPSLQQRTYQDAIAGSRMAQREVLKMIERRERYLVARRGKERFLPIER